MNIKQAFAALGFKPLATAAEPKAAKPAVKAASGNVEAIQLKLLDLEDNMDIRPNDYWPGMHESIKAYKVRHAFLTAVLKTVVRRNGYGQ